MSRKGDALARLKAVRERNELARERMDGQRARFDRIANRDTNGTAPVAVSSFNLFPTPPAIAARMVELADIQPDDMVLEPSAGTGRILDALPAYCDVVAVELSADIQPHLYERYPRVLLKCGDFLARTAADLGGPFDRVIMNPPFHRGEDVKHIRHAASMLNPGGLLVALCYDGVKQNKYLKPIADTWERLPSGSFRSEGTGADVVILTIRK
jgi:phospholipid N-methyltransferase